MCLALDQHNLISSLLTWFSTSTDYTLYQAEIYEKIITNANIICVMYILC